MPYMDGLEFRAIQKSLPRLADVPVVVITAGGLPVENVESLGLVHTFFKPLDSARLLGMVQQLVCPLAR
jgi:CheY-like chemotaxis protein